MRPQAQSKVIPQARFRRAPSRCQKFWQGILILATLALAVAANAQSACYDVFAAKNAPLRPGNSVTIRYSFTEAKPTIFSNPAMKIEILTSTERQAHQLLDEAAQLRRQLKALEGKKDSDAVVAKRAELGGRIRMNRAKLDRIAQIRDLAKDGGHLNGKDIALLGSQTFEQTIVLSKKSDAKLLAQRISALEGNLATVENVKLPPARIKRVFNLMMKHKIITLVLVSAIAGLANQGYDLYITHQQHAQEGVVTTLYFEGTGNEPIAPAHDDPNDAVGNN